MQMDKVSTAPNMFKRNVVGRFQYMKILLINLLPQKAVIENVIAPLYRNNLYRRSFGGRWILSGYFCLFFRVSVW